MPRPYVYIKVTGKDGFSHNFLCSGEVVLQECKNSHNESVRIMCGDEARRADLDHTVREFVGSMYPSELMRSYVATKRKLSEIAAAAYNAVTSSGRYGSKGCV